MSLAITKQGCLLEFIQNEFGNKFYKHTIDTLNLQNLDDFIITKAAFSLIEKNYIKSDYFIRQFMI